MTVYAVSYKRAFSILDFCTLYMMSPYRSVAMTSRSNSLLEHDVTLPKCSNGLKYSDDYIYSPMRDVYEQMVFGEQLETISLHRRVVCDRQLHQSLTDTDLDTHWARGQQL